MSNSIISMEKSPDITGKLFVISTPIGNLEDITFRAVNTLQSVDRIAAEDTRRTRTLLQRYGISKPLISFHDFNESRRAHYIVRHLLQGESIALVSDAGTPGISDPGFRLIREAIENEIPVIPIPGPSAILAGLPVSGLPTDSFVFEGFIESRGSRRIRQLKRLKDEERTLIMFDSPHRIIRSLEAILDILGNRQICIARELTKVHEEWIRGDVEHVLGTLKERKEVKGEITLIIQGTGKRVKKEKRSRMDQQDREAHHLTD